MDYFRSADMTLFQVTIPRDEIWKVIEAIGHLDIVHFMDLNRNELNANKLNFTNQIKRCDETERKIIYLLNKCREYRILISKPASIANFKDNIKVIEDEKRKGRDLLFDAIEEEVNRNEKFIKE